MLIRTNITPDVLERLLNGETVKAKTNFNNPFSEEAYLFLKQAFGFDNFFFGLIFDKKYQTRIEDLCSMSSIENSISCLLNIDKSRLKQMNYYDFSDLIYYIEHEPNPEIVETIKDIIKTQVTDYIVQVIYEEIRPKDLLEYHTLSL